MKIDLMDRDFLDALCRAACTDRLDIHIQLESEGAVAGIADMVLNDLAKAAALLHLMLTHGAES